MKFENITIICVPLLLLAFAILGIENPLYSWHRPMFAITMNLAILFGIIGYVYGYAIEKRREKARKELMLIEYLERYKKENK